MTEAELAQIKTDVDALKVAVAENKTSTVDAFTGIRVRLDAVEQTTGTWARIGNWLTPWLPMLAKVGTVVLTAVGAWYAAKYTNSPVPPQPPANVKAMPDAKDSP